jgi:CubicO group peptidase (beta-lactamase class C family)
MRRNLSLVAATLAMAVTSLAAQSPSADWRDEVSRFAQSLADAQLVPAMSIAVTQGDRVVYSRAFGFADIASGRRADERTVFYIASSTKALTATAVLARAARGELDLNASIAHYLPALRGRGRLNADSITLRDLLTMSHGLDPGGPVVFRTAYTGELTPDLLVELLAGYAQSPPPRPFQYGNLGYNILGLVLDPRRGDGWKDIVKREVLDPLGMRETSARVSDFQPDTIAMPHEYGADGKYRRIRLAKADANMHAAGGHFTTARDLARFVAAHASSGRLDGAQVFPRELIASAHRQHVDQNSRFGPFRRSGWGYGWDLGTYGDETLISRFGGFSGYRSHMSFMPDRREGVVVLANDSGLASAAADVVATYIYDRLHGKPKMNGAARLGMADLRARADAIRHNLTTNIAERRARTAPLPRALQDYAGVYENARLGRMEWRVAAGALELRMGVVRSEAEVFDAKQNQWLVRITGDDIVEFAFAAAGPARALQYRAETFVRVK